jgi:hypothetical protein
MKQSQISSQLFADWKDHETYPPKIGTRMRQWAWEFLRRNPDYQADYERWLRTAPKDRWPDPGEDMSLYQFDPPARDGETFLQYERRVGRTERVIAPLYDVMQKKYHISSGFPPPPEDDDPPRFVTAGYGPFLCGPQREVHWRDGLAAQQAIYLFDLTLPLEAQCRRALRVMQGQQRLRREKNPELYQIRRAREDLFQDYLRVLDAVAARVPIDEIAATLFPKRKNNYGNGYLISQTIRNYRKAATQLRDTDYRILPMVEITKKRSLKR